MRDSTAEASVARRFGILSSVALLLFFILRSQTVISIISRERCGILIDHDAKACRLPIMVRFVGDNTPTLSDAYLGVGPVDFAQSFANLAYGRVGTYGIDDIRHCVGGGDASIGAYFRFLRRGFLQGIETAAHIVIRSAGTERLEFGRLLPGDALVDVEYVRRFFFHHEFVHPHNDFLFGFGGALILVRGLSNFLLRITALDG